MTVEEIARVKNVSHRYGATISLDDVSIDIPARIMVGVIGPDGVGKSTLLALIAGVRRIQQGQVLVFDKDVADRRNRDRAGVGLDARKADLGRELAPVPALAQELGVGTHRPGARIPM